MIFEDTGAKCAGEFVAQSGSHVRGGGGMRLDSTPLTQRIRQGKGSAAQQGAEGLTTRFAGAAELTTLPSLRFGIRSLCEIWTLDKYGGALFFD